MTALLNICSVAFVTSWEGSPGVETLPPIVATAALYSYFKLWRRMDSIDHALTVSLL